MTYQLKTAPVTVGRRILETLKDRISDGVLRPGDALPSTRAMAADLGVSRSTVVGIYEQLAAEGYIETAPGAKARVSPGVATRRSTGPEPAAGIRRTAGLSAYGRRVVNMSMPAIAPPAERGINFLYGALSDRDFPALIWRRAYARALMHRQPLLYYGSPFGEEALRVQLQGYLRRARGLSCTLEQLLIVQGSQQALDLCARVLIDPGDPVIFEEPGYPIARRAFEAAGANVLATPVDEHGLVTGALPQARTRLAYVTPSHQFPLGAVMSIGRRRELLAWASRQRAWIIEDDYDSEFRYGAGPIDTLQSLDASDSVIYVGTFSKSLSPQMRLGYMVLPRALVLPFGRAKQLADRQAPRLDQVVLAELMASGAYERHVRRMRRHHERRRSALLAALERHLPAGVTVQGTASGLHVVAWFEDIAAQAEARLVALAREAGVGVWPVTPLYSSARMRRQRKCAGLVLGYASLELPQIDHGIRRLAAAAGRLRA